MSVAASAVVFNAASRANGSERGASLFKLVSCAAPSSSRSIDHFPRDRSMFRDRMSRKPARARREFVVNRHPRANRTGLRDVSFEFYELGMSYNAIGDIDGEVVTGIACALLRHKGEIPEAI
jgi:hypothetical protein